jgi:DNA-binding transcriptional MocR family regulator
MNASEIFKEAVSKKVAFVPGEPFFVSGGQNTFRLNFSNATLEQIDRGVDILGKILNKSKK